VANNTQCTGKQNVQAIAGNETAYIQWNVNVPSAGTYSISLRYAHNTSPRPLSVSDIVVAVTLFLIFPLSNFDAILQVFVNAQQVTRQLSNPNTPINFNNIATTPTAAQLPLQRCASDCDSNADCSHGLFCMQNNGLERVPGCIGVQTTWDYCVDIKDFDYGFTLLPTGSSDNKWHMSEPLSVTLVGE
jgi:hypothetical protein